MQNGVNGVIPSFHIVGSFGLSQLSEPIFMRLHVIGCTESRNHTFSELKVLVGHDDDIEFALFLITNISSRSS